MKYLGPVVLMCMALAVLLAAAGVIPWLTAVNGILAVWAILFLYFAALAIRVMTRKKAAAPPPFKPSYLIGVADGRIEVGDLVRLDVATGRVKRVERLPDTPDGQIQ